jgi:predicted DNA-binding transcriptional regulator AlpA
MSEMTIDRFVPRPEVLSMVGVKSPTTLYEMIRCGDFPRPYSITVGRKGWSLAEVQQWIARKKQQAPA